MCKSGAHVPRYMGRRRSIPGDPPRVRWLRESFGIPIDPVLVKLVAERNRMRAALGVLDRLIADETARAQRG